MSKFNLVVLSAALIAGFYGSSVKASAITYTANISTPAADGTSVDAGSNITYAFTVSNTSVFDSPSSLSIPIPAGTTFVSIAPDATWTLTGSTTVGQTTPVVYTNAAFTNGTTSTAFTLVVKINSSQAAGTNNISFTPTVSATGGNTGSGSATRLVTTTLNADMSITIAGPNAILPGGTRNMTITYTCVGPSDAIAINYITLPPTNGATFSNLVSTGGPVPTSMTTVGGIQVNYPTITVGTVITITYTETIPIGAAIGSIVSDVVQNNTFSRPPDSNPANDTDTSNATVVSSFPTLSIDSPIVSEGDVGTVNATFTVTLSAAFVQIVSVDFATQNGTGIAPNDYFTLAGTIFFNPGEVSKPVTIQVVSNTLVEANKTFSVVLSNPVNASIVQGTGVCTIQNDDIAGALQFAAANYTVNANAGTANITVTRTGGSANNTTINYATSDGTAVSGQDYTGTSGVLTFNAGEVSKTFPIILLNKPGALSSATVNLTLSNPSSGAVNVPGASATLGAQSTAIMTILAGPTITSALSVSSQVGAQFIYMPTATGQPVITFSLPNPAALPAGLTFTAGFITGIPTVVGSFAVPLRADNGSGFDLQTLVITITAPTVPPGSSNSTLDSDGDGFPDELEIAIGSNPFDSNSTPLGILLPQKQGMKNVKLSISLNFAVKASDSIKLSGAVILPAAFAQSGKLVYFDIGGVIRRFALDADGASVIGSDTVKFKLKKAVAGGVNALVPFTLSIKDADIAALLIDEGLTNATFRKALKVVPVIILLNTTLYSAAQNQLYTATAGRTGKTKNP